MKNHRAKLKVILLLLIILLATILRVWRLDQYPVGLNADEAAIGYNVYSLIQTGKDEHGHSWPLHFQSFNDYKPGLYFYLVLPFVKLLGLNIWAVRLPSAILGVLSVLLIYLLVQEIFPERNKFSIGEIAAFLLAISPWHLHFSRGGWEVNAGTFFILTGVYLFLKSLKAPNFFPFSILSFAFSLYTYHSARVIVPLLGLGLVLFYRKEIFRKTNWRYLLITGILGALLLLPLGLSFLGPAGASRFAGVGLLADTGPFWRINQLRGEHGSVLSSPVRLLHNKLVAYGIAFVENWLDHFHGEFLFLSGDVIERSRVPETGQLYLFEIPFVILGAYMLLKKKPKNWQLIFLWLGIAPVAAAMTFQTPHALRAHNMVIPMTIISAYGACQIIIWLKANFSQRLFYVVCSMLSVLCCWNVARYLRQYYVYYPQTYPSAWEDGFQKLTDYVKEVEGKYQRIYVTDHYDQPYILFLFYLQYPPEKFQREGELTSRDEFGFSTVRNFGKFHFGEIKWDQLRDKREALLIGTGQEIPEREANVVKTVYFKNDQPAFEIVSLD